MSFYCFELFRGSTQLGHGLGSSSHHRRKTIFMSLTPLQFSHSSNSMKFSRRRVKFSGSLPLRRNSLASLCVRRCTPILPCLGNTSAPDALNGASMPRDAPKLNKDGAEIEKTHKVVLTKN